MDIIKFESFLSYVCVVLMLTLNILDEYMKKLIQEAKGRGLTIKVRYAKILFCGASGAGKTSFTHLLKNKKLETKQHSTGLTDLQHIMISEKASFEGTEWIDLNPYEEFLQLKLRMHHIKLLSQTEELSQQITDDGSPSSFTEAILNVNQEEPDVHQKGRIPDVPQQEVMSIRQGRRYRDRKTFVFKNSYFEHLQKTS